MAFRIPPPTADQDARRAEQLARVGKTPTGPLAARLAARVKSETPAPEPEPVEQAEPTPEPAPTPKRRR